MRKIIKRVISILLIIVGLMLVGCGSNKKEAYELFDKAIEKLNIPETISDDIDFPSELLIDEKTVLLTYNSDNEVLESDGSIHPYVLDQSIVNLDIKMQYGDMEMHYLKQNIVVLSMKEICEKAKDSINIPSSVMDDLNLPHYIGKVRCKWDSSNINLISKEGKTAYVSKPKEVKLTCTYLYKNEDDSYKIDCEYNVTLEPWNAEKRFNLVKDLLNIPNTTLSDISLPTRLDYDVLCNWKSSNEKVINNVGNVNRTDKDEIITLTANLTLENSGESSKMTFEVKVLKAINVEGEMNFFKHILVNRAKDIDLKQTTGLIYNQDTNRIELSKDSLIGAYESCVYNTLDFYRIVGSFSCITSEKATAELEYSIKVNGVWSKYLSYGEFGLGRTNVYYNQTDTLAMIDTDMVIPLNKNVGNAFKYRITLRRDSLETLSPALSLVATAIFMNDYNYVVDTSNLPDSVDWDVPKLNQNIVPKIGNVICSATTTTMLLKYAGFDFSDKGYTYEHEFMAKMVADTGHNNPTYGNWSYNMMAAGGFGVNAYVGKYYSWDEIRYHLANYGPLGVSIGGNFGRYTTQGHLLVLRGYRIENGETTVICNDPNIEEVYYEVSLETFLSCLGSVVYIMEFDKEVINFK